MKKILAIVGTRPEAVKLALLCKSLLAHNGVDFRLCISGQHKEMLNQVLELFSLSADYDLAVMRPGQSLFDITGSILVGVGGVLSEFKPDKVIVHGDTTTAFAAALASFYCQVPVYHVEAGLRSGDIYSPWPEEVNRKLVAGIATRHYAPTNRARDNLLYEGINTDNILVTGNTVIDALLYVNELIDHDVEFQRRMGDKYSFLDSCESVILVTGHRRESFGEGFKNFCLALKDIAGGHNVHIIYPVHMNPNVQNVANSLLGDCLNIALVEPVDYLEFTYLMGRCKFIITDSGGIQEEAPSLGKPVLVTRDVTERPEAVEAGTVFLTGTDRKKIVKYSEKLLTDEGFYRSCSDAHNPYGDGMAVNRITEDLLSG